MYGDYWQLQRRPFENDGDPEFFFCSRAHEAALLKLQFLIEQAKGTALLVGGHGLGKTYVTRVLESHLDEVYQPIVRLMFPRLSEVETLSYLARGLGAPSASSDSLNREEVVRRLEAQLDAVAGEGYRPVFIIDDAHLIDSPQVLEGLAMVLSHCELHGLPLSLILTGQPELLPQVQRVAALDERVAIRMALHPLSADESREYVAHRLRVAGLDRAVFDEDAMESFASLSRGVPRRLNQLCDLALLVGYADKLDRLTRYEVEAAAEELTSVSVD